MVKLTSISEYKTYSVSRLKSYDTCSQLYKNKYIDKIKVIEGSYYTLLGSLVHKVLEDYYSNKQSLSPIQLLSLNILDYLKNLGVTPSPQLANYILEYTQSLQELYLKSKEDYIGNDSIRKADGSIALVPEKTTGWKRQYQSLGLDSLKQNILLLSQDFDTRTPNKDISDVFSEAYNLLLNYKHPSIIHSVDHIEFPLSHLNINSMEIINPVLMPSIYGGDSGIYLNGYIDLIGKDASGNVIILDHKTSSEEFKSELIPYNVQLLSYAWAYESLTNTPVSFIGINNIRAGSLAISPTPPPDVRDNLLKTLFNKHILIKHKVFSRHLPESNSPCLKMYGSPCPYLSTCWPSLSL